MKMRNYIPPKERLALLLLVLLIISAHTLSDAYHELYGYSKEEKSIIISEILAEEIPTQQTIISSPRSINPQSELSSIDPNVVEIEKLANYGISDYAAKNLQKYRKAGGVFNNMSDLKKIYGMDSVQIKNFEHHFKFPNTNKGKVSPDLNVKVENISEQPSDQSHNNEVLQFDPNTASYKTLISNGFSKFAAKNLMKYRDHGGQINRDSDLLKIYGVDTTLLSEIITKIQFQASDSLVKNDTPHRQLQNIQVTNQKNVSPSFTIDLNFASQQELMKLVGIGPVISKRILDYRERLGGYHKKEQLLEIYALTEELLESIDEQILVRGDLTKIYAPNLSFKEVLRHPYCDYETTKVLKNISLLDYDQELQKLIKDGEIDHRLVPYLQVSNPLLLESKNH